MSETKRTPLPWRQHDSGTRVKGTSVCAILGSEYGDFRDKVIASYIWEEADGQLIVTAVNARPKVEELVKAGKSIVTEFLEMSSGIEDTPYNVQRLAEAIREVESALQGEA